MVKLYDYKELSKQMYCGLICDVLDYFGYRKQNLSHEFFSIIPNETIFGRAYTVLAESVNEMPEDALVNQCRSVEGLQNDEVYVLAASSDCNCGIWGEIMATAASMKGCKGAVISGMVRDTNMLVKMGFPVFCKGRLPTTSKGRAEIISWQKPIEIDGVIIKPGDLIFADIDGIVVIPNEIEDKVIEHALHVLSNENIVRNKILAGESIVDTYLTVGAI